MNVLIFGAGAIGGHLGYCFYEAGHNVVLVSRGDHYAEMKKNGMRTTICDNEVVLIDKTIKDDDRFRIFNDINDIDDFIPDYIFITVKLKDYNSDTLSDLSRFIGSDTAIIPPCTKLPFWWFYNMPGKGNEKYRDLELDASISKYLPKENIIGMTMWISAVLEEPGHVVVKHTQRGYPLDAIFPKMERKASALRDVLDAQCLSPRVDSIRSEIYTKSINSFAFNCIAIITEHNNYEMNQDEECKDTIRRIMEEGDKILTALDLPVIQSIESRITQTLSSTKHTMSMLYDYLSGKPVELEYIWDGFEYILKQLDLDMPLSRQAYEQAMVKVRQRDAFKAH